MQLTSGTVSYVTYNYKHRLPQARCLCHPLSIRPPVAAEGRFKGTSPIHVTNSNLESNLSIAELIDYAETRVRIAQSGRVRLCLPCVPVTQSRPTNQHDCRTLRKMRENRRRSTYLVIAHAPLAPHQSVDIRCLCANR